MKGISVIYSIETLLKQGKSISTIARILKIDRKTVRKYKKRIEAGNLEPLKNNRKSILDEHKEKIEMLLDKGYSVVLIHRDIMLPLIKT